jgi:hypothetical protein
VEFENSFEGQQNGEIVVDKKNATFHVHLLPKVGDAVLCGNQLARSGDRDVAIAGASAAASTRLV